MLGFDHATMGAGLSAPGMDTRQWHSYGIVDDDHGDQKSTRFTNDDGSPLIHGVLVDVTLQPSGISLPCRVLSPNAGAGEAEYHPYVAGDEVYVLIPEGDERSGGIIIGRLNQMYDTFPTSVAGQDVTTNTFAFKRIRTPFILETASGYQIRQASTGANLTVDQKGQWFLVSGDQAMLSLTPDVVSLQLKDATAALQLDASKQTAALISGASTLLVDANASFFQTQGTLALQLGGTGAYGHAITVEQVLMLLSGLMTATGATIAGPLTGAAWAAAQAVILPAAVTAAAKAPFLTPLQIALYAALATSNPDPTGAVPGVANASFMF